MEDAKIIDFIRRKTWIRADVAWYHTLVLGIMVLPKSILLLCLSESAINVTPYVSLGVSVWRLGRRDYGDAGGDAANRAKLAAALDIFYALILFQNLCVVYWATIDTMINVSVLNVAEVTKKEGGDENWSPIVVEMYRSETKRKFKKDGELPDNWNLITYAVGLLQSSPGDDDHLWGARVLDKLFDKDISVRQELLSSKSSIQNLIGMIGRRGIADNIESRERAARIVAHLANDLHITQFPGTLQGICSLLESCKQYWEPPVSNRQSENPQQRLPDKKDPHGSLETSEHQDAAHTVVPIKDQTDHEQVVICSSSAVPGVRIVTACLEWITRYCELIKEPRVDFGVPMNNSQERRRFFDPYRHPYESRGAKELISQGLLILERLTQDDENCAEISKHQRLLSNITSPVLCCEISKHQSHDFLSSAAMVGMLSKSLTVVSRLLTSPGDGATRLRQELASNTEAVCNLMGFLEADSEGAQELHEQALDILTELAFDNSSNKLDFNKLLKALVRIFLEANNTAVDVANSTIVEVEQADRDQKATSLTRKAGEALARLLPVRTATDVHVADKLSRQETIDLLTKVFNQILSSEMGTTADAVKTSVTEMENLTTEVFHQIISSKMGKIARARAVKKMENLVIEVNNQLLSSKLGTPADAAKRAFTRIENLSTEVLNKTLSSKIGTAMVDILRPLIQRNEKLSEEKNFMAAMLSLAVVICNENVVSKEDIAHAIHEDAALVKKLKEILEVNKHGWAESLKIVKLICHVVVTMIQVKSSCTAPFNEHDFKEALTDALETMSEVDDCMLFAENDREVIKPARSLTSLVKEAQEHLNIAQEQGN